MIMIFKNSHKIKRSIKNNDYMAYVVTDNCKKKTTQMVKTQRSNLETVLAVGFQNLKIAIKSPSGSRAVLWSSYGGQQQDRHQMAGYWVTGLGTRYGVLDKDMRINGTGTDVKGVLDREVQNRLNGNFIGNHGFTCNCSCMIWLHKCCFNANC